MSQNRLQDYLSHIEQASADILDFMSAMSPDDFLADKRTQRAVVMSLVIIGEAATKIMEQHPDFTDAHSEIPWRNMRGMRNRMAHGYFDINLELVWSTAQDWIPQLIVQVKAVRAA
jgi:uncharacterized protein with HEPN domain